jgi:hypothetical protein
MSKTDIENDAPVDQATAAGVPFAASEIDDTHSCAGTTGTIRTDCKRNRAHMWVGRSKSRRNQRLGRLQNCNVRTGIASGGLRCQNRTSRRNQFEFILARQSLFGNDDDTALPQQSGQVSPLPDADGDDGIFGGLGPRRERTG